jgi:uncharacterized protein (DUF427 family)
MTTTSQKRVLTPGPDHTLAVDSKEVRVAVTAGAIKLATNAGAAIVREHTYPAVFYVNRDDINMTALERSNHTSWCPYKGLANYFHILGADGSKLENAVWTYEAPFDHIATIRDRLGFYTDRVDISEL